MAKAVHMLEDPELTLLKKSFKSNRKALLSIVAILLCLLSIREPEVESIRPLVFYGIIHIVTVLAFEWRVEGQSNDRAKLELGFKEPLTTFLGALGCILCARLGPRPVLLLRLSSTVLLPVMVVGMSDFSRVTQVFLATHAVWHCAACAGGHFPDGQQVECEGWQCFLGLLGLYSLLFALGRRQAEAAKSQAASSASFRTLGSLLDMGSDGFFVLDRNENVLGMNWAAETSLGLPSLEENGTDRNSCAGGSLEWKKFHTLVDLEDPWCSKSDADSDAKPHLVDSEGIRLGMGTTWLCRPGHPRVKLKMYTVPCELSPLAMSLLLKQRLPLLEEWQRRLRRKGDPSSCSELYIRSIRVVEREEHIRQDEPNTSRARSATSSIVGNQGSIQGLAEEKGEGGPSNLKQAAAGGGVGSAAMIKPSGVPSLFFKGPWRLESLEPRSFPTGNGSGTFKVIGMAARSGHGLIKLAQDATGKKVAIKEIDLVGHRNKQDYLSWYLRTVNREAGILKKMAWAAPVVVRFIDSWLQNDFSKACVVTEWLPVTLEDSLQRCRASGQISVDKSLARKWLAHIVAGIAAIHAAGFVHRDVKPSNIWQSEDLQLCKIAGLGISKPLKRKGVQGKSALPRLNQENESGICDGGASGSSFCSHSGLSGLSGEDDASSLLSAHGSCCTAPFERNAYSSPELISSGACNQLTDIFSLGCILLEIMTLAPISQICIGACGREESPEEVAWTLIGEVRVRCFEVATDIKALSVNCQELPFLCSSMLSSEPNLRPIAKDILARSSQLQVYVVDLVQESPKLRDVLCRESRRVHFHGNMFESTSELQSDSEVEGEDSISQVLARLG